MNDLERRQTFSVRCTKLKPFVHQLQRLKGGRARILTNRHSMNIIKTGLTSPAVYPYHYLCLAYLFPCCLCLHAQFGEVRKRGEFACISQETMNGTRRATAWRHAPSSTKNKRCSSNFVLTGRVHVIAVLVNSATSAQNCRLNQAITHRRLSHFGTPSRPVQSSIPA